MPGWGKAGAQLYGSCLLQTDHRDVLIQHTQKGSITSPGVPLEQREPLKNALKYLCQMRCTQGVSKDKNNQTSTSLPPVMETTVIVTIVSVQIAK